MNKDHYIADLDKNNEISVTELKVFVLAKVEEITRGLQKPMLREDNLMNDFRIW